MKTLTTLFISAFCFLTSVADECWEIKMSLQVPRVVDNAQSCGYRKYQTQRIEGYFLVSKNKDAEPEITFCSLVNKTHKVNGKPVTYDVYLDDVKWHGIGSNKTGKFDTRSVVLSLTAEPSYSIGEEPTEDNSLLVVLSGKGNEKSISGYVAGQLGCGCAEYGHVSPTRIWKTDVVVDTASAFGRWTAKKRW